MPVAIEGADQLRELAAKLKGADPKIRRELTTSLRKRVKPITAEIQQAVRTAPSHGSKGKGRNSGASRRTARALAQTKQISDYRAREIALKTGRTTEQVKTEHRAKQAAKAEAGSGLRETIARATAGSVTTSDKTGVGIRWKVAAAKMPNKQRALPKGFNSPKGWRHPVYGNRNVWVAQHGTPFFDTTIKKHQNDLRDAVVEGMSAAAEAILHEETA